VFAKAPTQSEYETMLAEENKIVKSWCFVVTATMGSATHPVVNDMRRFRDEVLSTNFLEESSLVSITFMVLD
jgi:hypothetical protein